jgi:hypothetical protein
MSKSHVQFSNAEMPGREMSPENRGFFNLLTEISSQNARNTIAAKGRANFFSSATSTNPSPRASGTKVLPHNPVGKVARTQAEIQQAQQNLNAKFVQAQNDAVVTILCNLNDLKAGKELSSTEIASLFTPDDKFIYKGVLTKELLTKLLGSASLSKHQIDTLLKLLEANQPPTPLICPEAGLPTAAFTDPTVVANLAAENEARRRAEAGAARAAEAENRERGLVRLRALGPLGPLGPLGQHRRRPVALNNHEGGRSRRTKRNRKGGKTRRYRR